MPASTGSTRPAASRGRSSRRRAGRMRGASSSTWRGSTRRRSPSRRSSRIDALFAIEREINGLSPRRAPGACAASAAGRSSTALETWLREQRARLSGQSQVAKAIDYSLKRWAALTRFLDDGRLCMTNNAAERALRGIAVGRHNWTFAGSDEGGRRAAAIYTLIETAKLNDVDPQAWLADVLARLQDHPAKRIAELLPWNWKRARVQKAAA